MPEVEDIGDGSQDACLVRVRGGRHTGWGECEASPLPTIAAWCAPMSHSACHPVRDSVLGETVDGPEDILRINARVRERSLDLLQADHALSGVDIALWDLLGRARGEPVWSLLGYTRNYPKRPYASVLFGDSPESTTEKARAIRAAGFRAAKFGWGPFGRTTHSADKNQIFAARHGLEDSGHLMVDAGTVFGEDVEAAKRRLNALIDTRTVWFEEPFVSGAVHAYAELALESGSVKLAGGEGCHNFQMARLLIDRAAIGYIQVDTGRIGGITTAKQVADYARRAAVTYVNHTFTSHLALSASLQPFAGIERADLAEYPFEAKALAVEMTTTRIEPDNEGMILAPATPGLGVEPDLEALKAYVVPAEIRIGREVLYRTPPLT